MLSDVVDRPSVERMVRHFYRVILKDEVVGHYFISALGDDLRNDKWYDHLRTLDNFWLFMMAGEEGYTGDPFFPHSFMGELYPETFDRWLELFDKTVHQFFVPEIASEFNKKAKFLSADFRERLEIDE